MAARNWKIHVVALKWVHDSIERAMILDETLYDPLLPEEDLGKGSWNKREIRRSFLGKRQRVATTKHEEGRRKLRKTASMKLNSQRENMWGEILGQPSVEQPASNQTEAPTQPLPPNAILRPDASMSRVTGFMERSRTSLSLAENRGDTVFASCCFHVFGFPPQQTEVLVNTVSSLGGTVFATIGDITASEGMSHRFVIVPQSADPTSHPLLPDGVEAITECFIEKCLHKKALLNPREHVIGRPFPVFPINGFGKLSICTAGFTDVDLLQVDRAIRQLGAKFQERFNAQCSLLLCTSLDGVRKQKLDAALLWRVPVVKANWLWECISQGKRLSTKDFVFPELMAKHSEVGIHLPKALNRSKSTSDMSWKVTPKSLPKRIERPARSSLPSVDMSAFDNTPLVPTEPPAYGGKTSARRISNATEFDTAPTHQLDERPSSQRLVSRPGSRSEPRPLAEKSASDINKPSAKDPAPSQTRKPISRVRSEVCDSEAGDDEGLDASGGEDDNAAGNAAQAEADAVELEKRLQEREKAEAERLALANKLTTLFGAPSRNSLDSTVAGAVKEDTRPVSRRRRDVLGRAISNVSMASTGSAESSSVVGGYGRTAMVHDTDSQGSDDAAAVPTATQIEYDDPEANKSKARLMSKMLGRDNLGGDSFQSFSEDRVSMAKVRPEEDVSRRPTGGRSMRRR